jgi:hypothetical protein
MPEALALDVIVQVIVSPGFAVPGLPEPFVDGVTVYVIPFHVPVPGEPVPLGAEPPPPPPPVVDVDVLAKITCDKFILYPCD